MAINYLSLAEAKTRLIDYGIRSALTLPSDIVLTDFLEEVEDRLIAYLGYTPGIRSYTEETRTDLLGRVFLRNYPVVEIQSLLVYQSTAIGGSNTPTPVPLLDAIALWDKSNALHCGYPEINIKIEYTAGLDDPDMAARLNRVIWGIVKQAFEDIPEGVNPSLGWLDEPTADETNLSLPGGLSHGLQLGKTEGGGSAGSKGIQSRGTLADRLFDPLSRFRRLYIL
jgi:hypothetical protein